MALRIIVLPKVRCLDHWLWGDFWPRWQGLWPWRFIRSLSFVYLSIRQSLQRTRPSGCCPYKGCRRLASGIVFCFACQDEWKWLGAANLGDDMLIFGDENCGMLISLDEQRREPVTWHVTIKTDRVKSHIRREVNLAYEDGMLTYRDIRPLSTASNMLVCDDDDPTWSK